MLWIGWPLLPGKLLSILRVTVTSSFRTKFRITERSTELRIVEFTTGRKYRRAANHRVAVSTTQLPFEYSHLECPQGRTVYTILRPCLPRRMEKARRSIFVPLPPRLRSRARLPFIQRFIIIEMRRLS